jgi:hypothetical protein
MMTIVDFNPEDGSDMFPETLVATHKTTRRNNQGDDDS